MLRYALQFARVLEIIKMIKSFNHKGLERFFYNDDARGIQAKHKNKLSALLYRLDSAEELQAMNFPSANLHELKGDKKGIWSVKVSGNWRMTFRFENGDAYIVDYQDYH